VLQHGDASPLVQGLDVLEKMLTFHPARRITAEEALKHPWFDMFRGTGDERTAPAHFCFDFESAAQSLNTIKAQFLREVRHFLRLIARLTHTHTHSPVPCLC
jgi:hypothetical protein